MVGPTGQGSRKSRFLPLSGPERPRLPTARIKAWAGLASMIWTGSASMPGPYSWGCWRSRPISPWTFPATPTPSGDCRKTVTGGSKTLAPLLNFSDGAESGVVAHAKQPGRLA